MSKQVTVELLPDGTFAIYVPDALTDDLMSAFENGAEALRGHAARSESGSAQQDMAEESADFLQDLSDRIGALCARDRPPRSG